MIINHDCTDSMILSIMSYICFYIKTKHFFMEIIIYTFKQSVAKIFDGTTSSSVAKHKLLRDTKKQQDVITSNRVIMTS
jgi:hypothetical protein